MLQSDRLVIAKADNSENMLVCDDDTSVELYYDGSKKFETTSAGVEIHGTLQMDDSKIARFGNDGDLQIYHTGSQSHISDRGGAGDLNLESNNQVNIKQNDAAHYMARFNQGGTAELYHNNVKTFQTDSSGAIVYGPEGGDCRLYLYADEGDDNADKWELISAAGGTFYLRNKTSGSWESTIQATGNSDIELYYDGSKKFETISSGVQVTGEVYADGVRVGDDEQIRFGANEDLAIFHDPNVNIIRNNNSVPLHIKSGTELNAEFIPNDAVKLYDNNSKKFETGVSGEYGSFTASNGAGGWSGMAVGGGIVFMSDGTDAGIWNDTDNEWMLKCYRGNRTELQYDGSKKLETYSSGINIDGHVKPGSNNSHDLGTSSYRWRNIYTNDLNLSNEGSANSVDGTWGNFTIQEGEDDLFLINKRNGKKYKFNLTEVS